MEHEKGISASGTMKGNNVADSAGELRPLVGSLFLHIVIVESCRSTDMLRNLQMRGLRIKDLGKVSLILQQGISLFQYYSMCKPEITKSQVSTKRIHMRGGECVLWGVRVSFQRHQGTRHHEAC
jgi:hypothetical protein